MQKTHVELIDDLDGSEATETVPFSLSGTEYEIDLNDAHATALRNALSDFIDAARRVKRGTVTRMPRRQGGSGAATVDRAQNQAMRAWARSHGYTVSERGRIPADVVAAYHGRATA